MTKQLMVTNNTVNQRNTYREIHTKCETNYEIIMQHNFTKLHDARENEGKNRKTCNVQSAIRLQNKNSKTVHNYILKNTPKRFYMKYKKHAHSIQIIFNGFILKSHSV